MNLRPALRIVMLSLLATAFVRGQATVPTIEKIDPPNWFAKLPAAVADPLLLIRGTGLNGAVFTVSSPTVRVTRSLTSPNGHWAMVWLNTRAVSPGTLHLSARSSAGSTSFDYRIEPLRPAAEKAGGFSPADVMYCIMPDRFADGDLSNDPPAQSPGTFDRSKPRAYHGGDLRGVLEHLDYLQGLGVTAIWLTPVVANDPHGTDYHGYGATDLYAVDPHLGSLADYRNLGDELHRRHMKLVFDDVPNHVGPHHPWVSDPPLPDWFHGSNADHARAQDSFNAITDAHASPRASAAALDGWFANSLADMNQGNPVVAQYLTENMIWWIEEGGVDALRIDTFPYVQRTFWQQYLGTLKTTYPHLSAVGEVSGADPTINAFFAGGRELTGPVSAADAHVDTHLDTPFDYPMYHALRRVLLEGRPMSDLETTLRQDWLYPHPELLVTFIGNHDVKRFLSADGATPELLRLGAGLIMTMRGIPQLYAGDEIDMQGGEDPDNRRDFPGGFPGDAANAFSAAGRTPTRAAMHDWVAALGKLRGESAALQSGRQQTLVADESSFAFLRIAGSGTSACAANAAAPSMLMAVNRSNAHKSLQLATSETALAGCTSIAPRLGDTTAGQAQAIGGGTLTIDLPAFGFAVYTVR